MNKQLVLLLLAIGACQRPSQEWPEELIYPERDIKVESIDIEQLILEPSWSSSEVFSGIIRDYIYVEDRHLGKIVLFDKDGNPVRHGGGLGRGPNETIIKKSQSCFPDETGDQLYIMGSSLNFDVFNPNLERTRRFRVPYNPDKSGKPSSPDVYSIAYENLVARATSEKLYVLKTSENPRFNFFDTPKYINEARHVGIIDSFNPSKKEMLVKGFPEIYHSNPGKYRSMAYPLFDLGNSGSIFVGFECDSTVWTCNEKGIPIKGFGYSGREMETDYLPVNSYNDADNYIYNREHLSRYGWIEYIPQTNVLFRSYTKIESLPYDGLQIYHGDIQIGDVPVPKKMEVAGYIEPYYYSKASLDEETGQLSIYRFKY